MVIWGLSHLTYHSHLSQNSGIPNLHQLSVGTSNCHIIGHLCVCVCQLAFTFHKLKGKACVVSNTCTRMDENCTKMSIPIIPSLSKQPNIQTSYQPISPNKHSSQPSCKSPLLIQFVPSFTFNAPRSIAGANAKAAGMMVLKPRSPLASARVA